MRSIAFVLLFIALSCAVQAQQDTARARRQYNWHLTNRQQGDLPLLDSVALATVERQKFVEDSLDWVYIKRPDTLARSFLVDKILKDSSYRIDGFQKRASIKHKTFFKEGSSRPSREPWVIAVIVGLFLYTAFLNVFLNADIRSVLRSFYTKNAMSQVDKDTGLINSWAFLGLFLLFSLTLGLILYQLTMFRNIHYNNISGFPLFISLAVAITALLAVKFLVLKFVGFVFGLDKVVSEYIAILNLTYFNIAFVFLPVVLCFSLLSRQFVVGLERFTLGAVVIIFAWQYLRNSFGIISNIRFHKFYLFIYLCALEICPVLILIKALNISF